MVPRQPALSKEDRETIRKEIGPDITGAGIEILAELWGVSGSTIRKVGRIGCFKNFSYADERGNEDSEESDIKVEEEVEVTALIRELTNQEVVMWLQDRVRICQEQVNWHSNAAKKHMTDVESERAQAGKWALRQRVLEESVKELDFDGK